MKAYRKMIFPAFLLLWLNVPAQLTPSVVPSPMIQLPSNSLLPQEARNRQPAIQVYSLVSPTSPIPKNQLSDKQIMPKSHYLLEEHAFSSIQYNFPARALHSGSSAYETAFRALLNMRNDSAHFSISRAVFITENAFYQNQGAYADFDTTLVEIANSLRQLMHEEGYNFNSNLAKNLMLFRYFSNTLTLPNNQGTHLPITYDFEDYRGQKDFTKYFVIKLLRENSGQCHSMPLLYLMLAERLDAEAYLAISPNHTYIKFPLPNGGYQNVELTSKVLNSDAHILQSGYIRAEALQHKIYMQPLNWKELLSQCLADLARSYQWKYGYAQLVSDIIDESLALYPNNIHALMLRANYDARRFEYVGRQIGLTEANASEKFPQYPRAALLLEQRNAVYQQLDALGFAAMPAKVYDQWLLHLETEKERQASQQRMIHLKRIVD